MVLENLLQDDSVSKRFSKTYKELFRTTPLTMLCCKNRWRMEVPNMDGDDWDDMWERPFKHLAPARDSLIQFKSLHRIVHMSLTTLNTFWSKVLECITKILGFSRCCGPVLRP